MAEFLEVTIDKFTFRVDQGCLYSGEGVWARMEGGRVRLGLSDYIQQRSGDIAFIDVKTAGTVLAVDDEFASIETVKANVMLASPVSGKISRVNPALEMNQRSLSKQLLISYEWNRNETVLQNHTQGDGLFFRAFASPLRSDSASGWFPA